MLGSYGPSQDAYAKNFESEESPSGVIARSGSYNVRSRVIDDDGEVYAGTCHPTPYFQRPDLNALLLFIRLGVELQTREGVGGVVNARSRTVLQPINLNFIGFPSAYRASLWIHVLFTLVVSFILC